MNTLRVSSAAVLAMFPAAALAQPFAIDWYSIDAGGITSPVGAGTYTLSGTIGQHDAGRLINGNTECLGGFWGAAINGVSPPVCYANCDHSTTAPVLNVLDFSCFLNRFAAGDSAANCDQSTTSPVLNVLDFSCFLNKFAAGCS